MDSKEYIKQVIDDGYFQEKAREAAVSLHEEHQQEAIVIMFDKERYRVGLLTVDRDCVYLATLLRRIAKNMEREHFGLEKR